MANCKNSKNGMHFPNQSCNEKTYYFGHSNESFSENNASASENISVLRVMAGSAQYVSLLVMYIFGYVFFLQTLDKELHGKSAKLQKMYKNSVSL